MTTFYIAYWIASAIISAILALTITIVDIHRDSSHDPIGSILFHTLMTIGCFLGGLAIAFMISFGLSSSKESKVSWKTIYPNQENVTISLNNRYLDKPLILSSATKDTDAENLKSDDTKLILTHNQDNKTTKMSNITVKGTGQLKSVRYKTYDYNFFMFGHKLFVKNSTSHGLELTFEDNKTPTDGTLNSFLK